MDFSMVDIKWLKVTKKVGYLIPQTEVYLILTFDIVFAGAYARLW
jgi:hypothetical protein